jgi:hypothetical protein
MLIDTVLCLDQDPWLVYMTGVGFGTLLAGLLTFVASFSKHVLAYQHVTATPFIRVFATERRAKK